MGFSSHFPAEGIWQSIWGSQKDKYFCRSGRWYSQNFQIWPKKSFYYRKYLRDPPTPTTPPSGGIQEFQTLPWKIWLTKLSLDKLGWNPVEIKSCCVNWEFVGQDSIIEPAGQYLIFRFNSFPDFSSVFSTGAMHNLQVGLCLGCWVDNLSACRKSSVIKFRCVWSFFESTTSILILINNFNFSSAFTFSYNLTSSSTSTWYHVD